MQPELNRKNGVAAIRVSTAKQGTDGDSHRKAQIFGVSLDTLPTYDDIDYGVSTTFLIVPLENSPMVTLRYSVYKQIVSEIFR